MINLLVYKNDEGATIENILSTIDDVQVNVKSSSEIHNLENENADVVIVDIPELELKETSKIMKFTSPTIIASEKINEDIIIRGDVVDYIQKPINEVELKARVKTFKKIKELKDKISNISTIDDLTGLHNRKFLIECLEAEMSRSKRYKTPVSCVLFDLDFFKVINDMYGYEWGDILLKRVAEMLKNLARKEDIVTRYGDEEFMAVLPNTPEEKAFIFAERFRRDVEKMSFIPDGETERHPIHISGGIASYPSIEEDLEESSNSIIRYAEHALYTAKKSGKNKIVLFSQVNVEF